MFEFIFGESKESKEKRELKELFDKVKKLTVELETLEKDLTSTRENSELAKTSFNEASGDLRSATDIYAGALKVKAVGPEISALYSCLNAAHIRVEEAQKLYDSFKEKLISLSKRRSEVISQKNELNRLIESYGKKPSAIKIQTPAPAAAFVPAKVDVQKEFEALRSQRQTESALNENGKLQIPEHLHGKLDDFFNRRQGKPTSHSSTPRPEQVSGELGQLPKVNFKGMHDQLNSKLGLNHASTSPVATQKTVVFRSSKVLADESGPKFSQEDKDKIRSRRPLYDA